MASAPAPLRPLRAARYSTIRDRGSHMVRDEVRRELNAIINAAPTQIHPDDREGYLDALLSDLEAVEGAVWTQWPEDLLVLALTAVRYLGRNPIGSQTLLTTPHLSTLLFHSGLPLAPSASPSASSPNPSATPGPADSTVLPPAPPPYSPQALEALKVLANLLVLHPAGRNRFHNAGGARAIAIALAGKDASGTESSAGAHEGLEEKERERVFLLGRLGFLVTVERKGAVEIMVDQEGIVESLVYYLTSLGPVPNSFAALSEVLKLATNIVRFYPKSSSSAEDTWDERFDPLLPSVLNLVHTLPVSSLVPPLSHTIQFLLFAPLLPRLTTAWCSVPEPASPSPTTSSVRSLLNKLGQISIPGSGSSHPRKGSGDKSAETSPGGGALSVPRAKSPISPGRRSIDGRKSPEPVSSYQRGTSAPPTRIDPTALPARLLRVLEDWFASFLPYGTKVDEERTDGIVVDEVLPPLILIIMKLAKGNGDMRAYLKEALLPSDLDRSPEAGPLEQRDSTLGTIVRLMQSSTHSATRDSAGELMWAVCNEDASTLSVEIGYGNAAGVLFHKGISGPPPARIEEIPDEPTSSTTTTAPPRSHASLPARNPGQKPVSVPVHVGTDPGSRHPITALSSGEGDDPSALLAAMSQEEKEREAERLFVLFGRMEKNPIIRASTGSTPGQDGGEGRSVNEVIGERMRSKEMEEWGQREDEAERRREREREEEEEREALRDLDEYKRRARSGRN